jgi:hypothetical protein
MNLESSLKFLCVRLRLLCTRKICLSMMLYCRPDKKHKILFNSHFYGKIKSATKTSNDFSIYSIFASPLVKNLLFVSLFYDSANFRTMKYFLALGLCFLAVISVQAGVKQCWYCNNEAMSGKFSDTAPFKLNFYQRI